MIFKIDVAKNWPVAFIRKNWEVRIIKQFDENWSIEVE